MNPKAATSKASRIGLMASAGAVLLLLSACNVLDGESKGAEKKPAPVAAAPAAPTLSLTEMANLRLPLPSPRHREGVQVASADPKQNLAIFNAPASPQELAIAYQQYGTGLAAAENSKLQNPKEVRRVLSLLRYKAGEEIATGWFVTQALIAAKVNAFQEGVNAQVLSKGREKFLKLIAENDNYVNSIKGAGEATQAVIAAVSSENARLTSLSAKFKDTAARFQKTKYGMQTPLPSEQVTQMAALEDAPSLLSDMAAALSPISTAQADYTPSVMAHILSLAARKIATDNVAGAPPSTADAVTARCMSWARLNLNQCVAAAHFPSEEAWCTGKHGLDDVRKCFAAVLPQSMTDPAPAATPAPAAKPASTKPAKPAKAKQG